MSIGENKRILCYNMLHRGHCDYNNKCNFAHSLDDQKIDPPRKRIYDIMGLSDLSKIDIVGDKTLFDSLMCLTKICQKCNEERCTGGYNCRNGSISDKYRICCRDLIDGDCKRNCTGIHLTNKGLIPYVQQKIREQNIVYGNWDNVEGVLKIDRRYFDKSDVRIFRLNISSSDEDTDEIIRYLNS